MEIISYSKMTAKEREEYAEARVREQKENEKRSGNNKRNSHAVYAGSKVGTGIVYFDTKDVFNNTTVSF